MPQMKPMEAPNVTAFQAEAKKALFKLAYRQAFENGAAYDANERNYYGLCYSRPSVWNLQWGATTAPVQGLYLEAIQLAAMAFELYIKALLASDGDQRQVPGIHSLDELWEYLNPHLQQEVVKESGISSDVAHDVLSALNLAHVHGRYMGTYALSVLDEFRYDETVLILESFSMVARRRVVFFDDAPKRQPIKICLACGRYMEARMCTCEECGARVWNDVVPYRGGSI